MISLRKSRTRAVAAARRMNLVSRELEAETASYVARDTAMQQRATILVGAASIVGALQVSSSPSWVATFSLLLALGAAIAGVVVVFPRTGEALDVRSMKAGLETLPLADGEEKLLDVKLEILEADERWLTVRGRFARTGFILLSLGIAIATTAALMPAEAAPPSQVPSQTPSVARVQPPAPDHTVEEPALG